MIRAMLNPRTRCEVVNGLLQTLGVAAIFGAALMIFNQRIGQLVAPLVPEPYINVVSLEYRDGRIWQLVRAENAAILPGTWVAGINGDREFVCAGSGSAPYFDRKEAVGFTPDEWTGDDCSTLRVGETYVARGSWNWIDPDGKPRGTTAVLTFVWQGPPA